MNAFEHTLKITLYRLIALGKLTEAELFECVDMANKTRGQLLTFQEEPQKATERLIAKIDRSPWEL